MTGEEREQDEQGQAPGAAAPRAVVVAVDAARLDLYARTLRMAQIPSRTTLDLDEAEALLTTVQPSVLVLDHGLPRLYILRLYGLVREALDGPRVKVLFVGQDGETGPDDYYLPGEPSPLGVAAQVGEMVAEADAAAASGVAAAPTDDAAVSEPAVDPAVGPDDRVPEPPEPAAVADADGRAAELVGAGAAGSRVAGSGDAASAGAAPVPSAIPAPPVESAPPRKRRRFDVIMFRVGMVLLILGGLLAFIRPESFTLPMSPPPTVAPPTVAPAPPTPAPAASPSPAALFEDAVLRLRISERSR